MKTKPRFTLLQVVLLGSLLAVTVILLTTGAFMALVRHPALGGESFEIARGEQTLFLFRSREELAPLISRFGPGHYSRYVEEWAARDFFEDRRRGVFLDVGAGHYRNESNTYFLETRLEWSGIAVDALPEYEADYRVHRPRTSFVAAFVADSDGGTTAVFEPDVQKRITSSDASFTARKGELGKRREVRTATLNRILNDAGVTKIDYLSMDIELAEPKALAGFDLARYRPDLVCIETHPEVRQQILDYFADNGYVIVGKYLRIDPTNVYFKPRR